MGSPAVGPGDGPCPLPATVPALEGKDGMESSLPLWGRAGRPELPFQGRVAGKEKPRKTGGMCRAVHPAGLEAKHLPGLTHLCWMGGLRREVGTPILSPMPLPRVPKMGQKTQRCRACPFPLIPLLFSSWFPKERRLLPLCCVAATLCSPVFKWLLGDLHGGVHHYPPSSVCQEESYSPQLLVPSPAWV